MRTILFTVDSYIDRATANGVCVKQVIDKIKCDRYEVHVLCYKYENEPSDEPIDGVYVHRIGVDLVHRLRYEYEIRSAEISQHLFKTAMKLVHRLQTVVFLPIFPMRNPIFTLACYKK